MAGFAPVGLVAGVDCGVRPRATASTAAPTRVVASSLQRRCGLACVVGGLARAGPGSICEDGGLLLRLLSRGRGVGRLG